MKAMRKSNLILTVPIIIMMISLIKADDQLGFVFEVVRHGARAPLADMPAG